MAQEKQSYRVLPSYPHLKQASIDIWSRYIAANPDAYDSVIYDFGVGLTPMFETIVNPATGGDDLFLYQRKIDVVGFKDGETHIIEIKPRADLGALGQVVSYATLYKNMVDPKATIKIILITDSIAPDLTFLADHMGVKLILI